MHRLRKTFTNVFLLLISLSLLGLSIRLAAASVSLERALHIIENSLEQKNVGHLAAEASRLLSSATVLNPFSADMWLVRAKFSGQPSVSKHDEASKVDLASTHFVRAIRLRPQSGSLWAEYAKYGMQQATATAQILARLDKALYFAPFKPSVRRTEVELALARWDSLNKPQQARFLVSIRYLLSHERRFVMKTAVTYGWAQNLRPMLIQDSHIQELDTLLRDQHSAVKP